MYFTRVALFLLAASALRSLTDAEPLDDYIRHYEPLHYDRARLHDNHHRVRRSLDDKVVLKFRAFNRPFEVHLVPENDIFSKTHKLKHRDGRLEDVDTSHIYKGSVRGEKGSSAHLAIIEGQAQGHIHIPGDTTYHIESASRFFRRPKFHSVIYAEKHMDLDPYKRRREQAHPRGSCGLDHVHDWMREVSESAITPPNRAKRMAPVEEEPLYASHNKYSEKLNRKKRANLGEKNTCYLYMRSDPMLWTHVKHEKYKETLNDERTKEEIIAFFASHVAELKKIYQGTTFRTYDDSLTYTGVNFLVQRSTIMTNASENCGTQNPSLYCSPNIDVSNFLNLNSKDDHDEFCLAYVFTYRDFTHGTLGLAWVGSASRAAGGICERYKEYPEGNARVKKSLNTGIVTIVNYGKTVPARVSQLTFAHEVGHNFGSPHDSGVTCVPTTASSSSSSGGGNFIMYASATMGDKANNDEFSACSKDNITRVLEAVTLAKEGKTPCFNKSDAAFCGNSIVEPPEECDCGYAEECQDSCCHGKGSSQGTECTLTSGSVCSPTQGPCCSTSCQYISKAVNRLCRASDDCIMNATCSGVNATCPASEHQPNMTYCNEFSQVCITGECTGSVCRKIGWEECFLQSVEGSSDGPSREELCYVACREPSTGTCVSSFNKDELENNALNAKFRMLLGNISSERNGANSPLGVQLPPGSPCDNYKGYCDVFHRCRGVDAEGPLARLKNLIFNPETLQTIRDWIVVHWWAVLLMAIALVVVMGLFIKVCAVHTPSSNPNKAPARKLTLPRRHGHPQGGGGAAGGHRGGASAAPKPGPGPSMPPQRTGYGEPPPPYSGPNVGGPAHGKGPRYNKGGNKRGAHSMELQRI